MLTLLASGGNINQGGLFGIARAFQYRAVCLRRDRAPIVLQCGRWWTILSASWLHSGDRAHRAEHAGIRFLGPAVADMYGPARLVIIYTAGGVAGFALSVFWGRSCRRFRSLEVAVESPSGRPRASRGCSEPSITTVTAAAARWRAVMPAMPLS